MKRYMRVLRPIFTGLISLILVMSMLPGIALASGDAAVITSASNPALYGALVDQCGFPDTGSISQEQLETVTGLSLQGVSGLTNIDGLENCSNLTSLSLMGCSELERFPANLSTMAKLKDLFLDENPNLSSVENLHAIATAPALNCLTICDTDITDVSFLSPAAAPALRMLLWGENPGLNAADFATLSKLTQLHTLQLYGDTALGTDGDTMAALAAMSNLTVLDLSGCHLTDISALASATQLHALILENNYLDLTPGSSDMVVIDSLAEAGCTVKRSGQYQGKIKYSTGAGTLSKTTDIVYYQQVFTLPSVSDIPAGYTLLGWDTNGDGTAERGAGDTTALTGPISALGDVAIKYTAVFSPPIHPPAETPVITRTGNPALYNAIIEGYGFPDNGGITATQLETLTELLLGDVPGLTSLEGVQYCSNIKVLQVISDDLTHLPADMSGMEKLEGISFDGAHHLKNIDNLSAVTTAPNLFSVQIRDTDITDVSFLASASKLRTLLWSDNPGLTAENIATLKSLTQLENLDLIGVPVLGASDGAALSTLADMDNLQCLDISDSGIYDITPLSGETNLSFLNLKNNYLDPTTGSPDRGIIDSLSDPPAHTVWYDDQHQITVHYDTLVGELSKASDLAYYQQNVTLQDVSNVPAGYEMLGWDTDSDGKPDHDAGDSVEVSPALPVSGDEITWQAVFKTPPQLAGISITPGSLSLSPSFSPVKTAYTIALPASVAGVTLKPAAQPGAEFTIDTENLTEKTYQLGYGGTAQSTIAVSSEDSSYITTYTVTITRDRADSSTLFDLGYGGVGTLLPAVFDPYHTAYTLQVAEDVKTVTFTPVTSNPASKLYIDGARKTTKAITLNNGQTKTVKIKVVGLKNKSKTYTVKVTRAKSTNDNITGLTVSNCKTALTFDAATQNYTMVVLDNKSSVTIKVATADPTETVYIEGHKATSRTISIQNASSKKIPIKIVAQAGPAYTRYYYVTLEKAPRANSFSASPKVSGVPTVVVNTAPTKPIKFTYSIGSGGGTYTLIEICNMDGSLYGMCMYKAPAKAGTGTFIWDGKTWNEASPPPPLASGTYKAYFVVVYHSPITGDYLFSDSFWQTISVQ